MGRGFAVGDKNSQIAILVERQDQPTRYRDGDRCTDQPRETLAKGALSIADVDRGSEMASHRRLTLSDRHPGLLL